MTQSLPLIAGKRMNLTLTIEVVWGVLNSVFMIRVAPY